jgi:hypothetical protein
MQLNTRAVGAWTPAQACARGKYFRGLLFLVPDGRVASIQVYPLGQLCFHRISNRISGR